MKRFTSHLAAILIAALVVFGITQLPPMNGLGVGSLFTIAWLILAVLALSAQMQQARLIGRARPVRRSVEQRLKGRGQ